MNKQDKRQDFRADDTATGDVGGSYSGVAGTMSPDDERGAGKAIAGAPEPGGPPDAAGDRNRDTGNPAHLMGKARGGAVSSRKVDHRAQTSQADRHGGKHGTGDSAPEVENRTNPPARGSQGFSTSDDSF